MYQIYDLYMSKLLALTTLIIIITLTFNLNLIPYVNSSPEPSTPSPEDIGDDYESNGSGEMNKGDLINKLKLTENDVDDTRDLQYDNGIVQTYEEQDITGYNEDGVDDEPPTSTERGGNPLEGLNLSKSKLLAQCEALKQETKGHEIEVPSEEKTLEEKCKEMGI
jgi:hypothetical protein